MSGTTEEGPRFVMIAENQMCYPEPAFIKAFGDAIIGQLAVAIPQGASVRKAARAVQGMKHTERYKMVLGSALRMLCESEGVDVEAVQRSGGSVVATFAI